MTAPGANNVAIGRFTEEEARILEAHSDSIDRHGPYDPHDTTFFVGHSRDGRLVEFDALTTTIDDIMEQCDIPEEHRDRLTELHRRCTEDFLLHYKGPVEGPIPLLNQVSTT